MRSLSLMFFDVSVEILHGPLLFPTHRTYGTFLFEL